MDRKVTGIVAYITWIGWIIAFLAGDKEGAKFHLNQALVVLIAQLALGIVSSILGLIPFIGGILAFVIGLVNLVIWVLGLYYAITDQQMEIPYIGAIKLLK